MTCEVALAKTTLFPLQSVGYKPLLPPLSQKRLNRGEKIKTLEQRAAELTNAQAALMFPEQRRALLRQKTETLKKLKATKTKHGLDTKLCRILEHEYHKGLILEHGGPSVALGTSFRGSPSPGAEDQSCLKKNRPNSKSSPALTRSNQLLVKHTRTSPGIEFLNPAAETQAPPIRRGQKHVPGNLTFNETKAHLFETPIKPASQARMQHLIEQDRRTRNFNIISGVIHSS
jgi:hypothetical protein